jgi:ABC-type nitrate/sulfonate/bicarbonate transport system substrate-binding protein
MTPLLVAGVPEPYNLPWHLAMEKGLFAKADIDLQWHTVHEGTGRMCQMLRDRQLDMAVLVTEGAVRDILNGGEHRIASTFVDSPLPWGVHVPAASALRTPEDLRGVPFAVSRLGSGSHIMAMLYAAKLGWRPAGDDLVVVHSMEGAAERMNGRDPLVFLWEKNVTSRYVNAGVMRCVDEVRGDWPGFVIVVREAFAKDHADVVHRALAVLREEARGLKHDPRAVELVMRNGGFSEALAREWLRQVRWNVGRPDAHALDRLIATLRDLSLVEPGSDVDPTLGAG